MPFVPCWVLHLCFYLLERQSALGGDVSEGADHIGGFAHHPGGAWAVNSSFPTCSLMFSRNTDFVSHE